MKSLVFSTAVMLIIAPSYVLSETFPQNDGTCITQTYSAFRGAVESKRWPYSCGCLEFSEFNNQYRNRCGDNQNVDSRRAKERAEEAARQEAIQARHEELIRETKAARRASEAAAAAAWAR
jgi:hypothetical protein